MFSFAMLGHWFACIWYVIGYEEFKRKEVNGWLYGLGIHLISVDDSIPQQYFSKYSRLYCMIGS